MSLASLEQFDFAVSQGLLNGPSHVSMRGNGIVEGVAEAVTLSPAFDGVLNKPVDQFDFTWPVNDNSRALPVWHVCNPSSLTESATWHTILSNCKISSALRRIGGEA